MWHAKHEGTSIAHCKSNKRECHWKGVLKPIAHFNGELLFNPF